MVRDHGKPVQGLRRSDFRVFEDGKPQAVTVFKEHRAADAIEVARAPDLPPGMYSNDPQYTLTSAANVVLLDALNTPYSDQLYVRHRMLQFLKTIPPGTRVAVFTLGSRLRMVEGFDAGPDVLRKALTESQSNPQVSTFIDPAYDQAMTDLNNMARSADMTATAVESMQQVQMDQQKFRMDMRVDTTIEAMQELGRYLSTIPGRKNLIWFSGAFPAIAVGGSRGEQVIDESDYDEQVKKMNALLALARVAVYPVDARGLSQSSVFTSEENPPNPRLFDSIKLGGPMGGMQVGGQPTVAQTLNAANQQYMMNLAAEQALMKQVAKATGGKAYVNTNAVGEAVGDAIANGSSYYTVGYVPVNKAYDGRYRTIRVRLEERHYNLEYRRGYYALDLTDERKLVPGAVNPMIAAMQRGAPELSQVLFRATALRAADGTVNTASAAGAMATQLKAPRRFVVDYWIDPATLNTMTLPDGQSQVRLEVTEVAYDHTGIRQNYADTALEVGVAGANSARPQPKIHVQQLIDVPRGQMFIRLGVQDLTSHRIGTLEIPLGNG